MACSITNLQVIAVGPPGGVSSSITISGHAEDCDKVVVNFSCGGPTAFNQVVTVDPVTGDWSVTTDNPTCACTKPFNLIVQCVGNSACQAVLNGVLQCTPQDGCPTVNSVSINPSSICTPDGTHRTVTFTATFTNSTTSTEVAIWEFESGIFSAPMNLTPGTSTFMRSYAYIAPGSYTPILHITLPDGCPSTSYTVGVPKCPPRCLNAGEITVSTASMCNPDGLTRDVTFTLPFSASVEFDFGDGDVSTIVGISTSHNYASPGSYTAIITVEGCPSISVPVGPLAPCDGPRTGACCLPDKSCIETTETDCTGRGGTYKGDGVTCSNANCNPTSGEPSGCGAFTYLIAGLMIVAIISTLIVISLQFCIGIPVPPWLWGVIIGIWAAVAVAIGLWYFLCWLIASCPCPKRCDWLALAWVPTLAGAIMALYLSGCCPWMLWVAIGLFAEAVTAFIIWLKVCDPGRCKILDLLSLSFATLVGTAFGFITLLPAIAACGLGWLEVTVGLLSAAIVTSAVACHAAED